MSSIIEFEFSYKAVKKSGKKIEIGRIYHEMQTIRSSRINLLMSLVKLANTCAHLQNCSRVRTTLTSIPYTKLHLQFAYNLYKHGFLSSLQKGSSKGPDDFPTDVTPDNISTRRLWVGLKYRDTKSVLNSCRLISKPNLRMHLNHHEMKKLCSGVSVRLIKPLQPGELILVRAGESVIDINEAVSKKLDGEVLCRVK